MNEEKHINLPGPLYKELQTYQKNSIFPSIDDLAAYILQEFLDKQRGDSKEQEQDAKRVIEERLKNLGYL